MAGKYLGDEFDIHGGGLDLRFPHHENELAQSRAAGRPFARIWMHNAMVNLAGEKMSKSGGNSLLVSEVVKRIRPIELRYYLLAPHYRSIIEFTEESLSEAATALRRIEGYVVRASELSGATDPAEGEVPHAFADAMDDDLATPAALAGLQEVIRDGNKLLAVGAEGSSEALRANLCSVRAMLAVLGLDPLDATWRQHSGSAASTDVVEALVAALLQQRQDARDRRDFGAADAIRDQLSDAGVDVEDTSHGPRWTVRT